MVLFLLWDPLFMAGSGSKMALIWPNVAASSTLQSGTSGSNWPKMANIHVVDQLEPFWVRLDRCMPKLVVCSEYKVLLG